MGVRFSGRLGIKGGMPTFRPNVRMSFSPKRKSARRKVIDDEGVCYVYVIEADDGGVKIGTSVNPERRLKQLSTGSTRHLQIAYQIPFDRGAKAIEFGAHSKLVSYRSRGEWFDVSADDAYEAIINCAQEIGIEPHERSMVETVSSIIVFISLLIFVYVVVAGMLGYFS